MLAFKIDPVAKTVKAAEHDGRLDDENPNAYYDVVMLDFGDCAYVTRLAVGDEPSFYLGTREWYAGESWIFGHSDDGKRIAPEMTLKAAQLAVAWSK